MHKECESEFISYSEKVIRSHSLWICNKEYKIHAVSIHIASQLYDDPFVEKSDLSRKKGTWFPYEEKYLRYIDLDMTKYNEKGGIRINCIRSVETGEYYRSAGDVYDHIKELIGGKEKLFELKTKKFDDKDISPSLYLSESTTENFDLMYLPRYGNFNFPREPSEYELKFLFVTHLVTRDLEFFADTSYAQSCAIILYLFLIKKEDDLLKRGIISEELLKKYIRNAFTTRSHGRIEIILRSTEAKKLTKEQICALFTYFIPKFHKIEIK